MAGVGSLFWHGRGLISGAGAATGWRR